MILYSTKDPSHQTNFREAVLKGLPPDNGLYMPVEIPQLQGSFFEDLPRISFRETAFRVSAHLLSDEIPIGRLEQIVDHGFDFPVEVKALSDRVYVLELFHGPTMAFKDFGARFMAGVVEYFVQQTQQEIHILVATSGDTGGAVGSGFQNTDGVRVTILYPSGKISALQEKQLTTLGGNVTALEVAGNFDDCQKLVKQAFLDKDLGGVGLSSANSINISRLIPQSFYYFFAAGRVETGNGIIFSVPSGNFGNLCAGLLAARMGLKAERFVASTNANRIFPAYLETGQFTPKPSIQTLSNAMDVGNPSNFARIMDLYDNDINKVKNDISSYSFTDEQTKKEIIRAREAHAYLMCPHTAVGSLGLNKEIEKYPDAAGIVLSTAHPAKFADVIEPFTGKIPLPEQLRTVLEKEKKALPIPNDYDALKSYLLNSPWKLSL